MGQKEKLMMQYRTDGMEYALRIAKEQGIEALEKEVKARKWSGISLRVTQKEIDEASMAIKHRCLDTLTIVGVLTLHDEFGFGFKRIQRYLQRFTTKAECLLEDYATWEDYQNIIKDELGFDLELRWN